MLPWAVLRRLPIRESLGQARRWYASMCNPPAWVEIDKVIKKGETTREEVGAALQWWKLFGRSEREAPLAYKRLSEPLRVEEDGVETMRFYVDRPSHAYVPPFYLVLHFSGDVLRFWHFEGYGGCK